MLTDEEIRELFKQHAPMLDFGEDVLAFARAIEGGAYLYSDRWYSRGEIAELARDAERYRWLRKQCSLGETCLAEVWIKERLDDQFDDIGPLSNPDTMDELIDAAIAAESPPPLPHCRR